jgi:predicted DsbA family dithiol-disulfide isomerase
MELLFKNYFEQGVNLNYTVPVSTGVEGTEAVPVTVFNAAEVIKSSVVTMDSVFVKCALEAGIPREKLQTFVDGFPTRLGGQLSSAVLAKDDHAKNRMRVNGVPCFVMETQNGRKPVVVSGGQPVQAMIGYLRSCISTA